MDLQKLADPFPADDIEWRVSRAGVGSGGIYCMVLAYITARGVQARLDEVCGPQNWRLEEPRVLTVDGKSVFACGLSIFCLDEGVWTWNTKWDVSEPTNIEPAKGGWSGAMKRAGAQWGIGRYLYRLTETFAEVSESKVQGWNYAKLPQGGGAYYWETPKLPGWALPKEPEHEITQEELNDLKRSWRDAFAEEGTGATVLREGFELFVQAVVGPFPSSDFRCWTRDALVKCQRKIEEPRAENGISSDVPFGE